MGLYVKATWQPVWPWLGLVTVVFVTVAAYHGVTRNGFVLDDEDTVQRNPAISSFAHVGRWFTSPQTASGRPETGVYRPILMASYALDRRLMGPEADGHHLTNLAIHLGTVVLVFVLGRRLWSNLGDVSAEAAALIAASLVALHPINSEVVNYVTARSSSLTAMCVLAAIWAYDRVVFEGRRWMAVIAYAAGIAALGTKEAGVVLPLLVLIWDRARGGSDAPWLQTVRRSLPWWGLMSGYLLWRSAVMSDTLPAAMTPSPGSVGQALLFGAKIFVTSVLSWLVPIGLAVDHAWPITIGVFEGVGLMLVILAAGAATAGVFMRWRQFGWCLIWFWTAMLPIGALPLVSRSTLYQDNRLYLGGMALAWAVGGLVTLSASRWSRSTGTRVLGIGVGCGLAIAAAVYDAVRTDVWRNDVLLWNDVLSKYPRSVIGHHTFGVSLLNAGRIDEAEQRFLRALEIEPMSSHTHYYLGRVHARRGDWEKAAAEFTAAIEIYPGFIRARRLLGEAHARLGHIDRAIAIYEDILRRTPDDPPTLVQSARWLESRSRFTDAAERYRGAIATGYVDDEIVMEYGGLLLRLQRWAEAERVFSSMATRDPSSSVARFNLGTALEGQGAWERAVEAYRAAAALNATDPDPLFRIGVLFSKQERWTDAAAAYDDALARDPAHAPTHLNLGILAQRLGDRSGAMQHYEAVLRTPATGPGDEALHAQARHAVSELRAGEGKP